MNIEGARVVVTGASQGIGRGLALEFARRGATVLGVARNEAALAELSSLTGGSHLVADLSDAAQVDDLVARCIAALGGIDIFVNNAGVETNEPFVRVDPSEIRFLARLNFETPLVLTRHVLAHMMDAGRGHIVQMSSVIGAGAFPGMAAYAGSKAGLTNFTETLRLELAAHREIGLTVVAPGPVTTEMWDRVDRDDAWSAPALRRFRIIGFLPKISPDPLVRQVVNAVAKGKPWVRPKARYQIFHILDNAPRRMVRLSLLGVRLGSPRPRP